VEIYTVGFTQTTAEHFFGRLKAAGIQRLLDVRLNNSSQLAGFAKAKDLPYWMGALTGASGHSGRGAWRLRAQPQRDHHLHARMRPMVLLWPGQDPPDVAGHILA
jgi:hypothetical protein